MAHSIELLLLAFTISVGAFSPFAHPVASRQPHAADGTDEPE